MNHNTPSLGRVAVCAFYNNKNGEYTNRTFFLRLRFPQSAVNGYSVLDMPVRIGCTCGNQNIFPALYLGKSSPGSILPHLYIPSFRL